MTAESKVATIRQESGVGVGATLRTLEALVERDLTVLTHELVGFLLRTIIQPALFAFVFVYVFPRIGQSIGGGGGGNVKFADVLLPGLMASTLMFQGIQAVALPLVQEFSVSKEIEDRVMAPAPVRLIGMTKIVSGAIQGMLGALVVMPTVWVASGFDPEIRFHNPLVFVTLLPLAPLVAASLALLLAT